METSNAPPNPTLCLKHVEMIQFMRHIGSISTELGCTVIVLIQKLKTDTWVIGLLEVVWKVVEVVIDTRIKTVVQLHNVLHVFFAGRGTGTAITDIKLDKELESVDQDPLLLVFLDLRKSLKKNRPGETNTNSGGI